VARILRADYDQTGGTEVSESRKDVMVKALEAEVGSASVDLGTLFTDDVVGWSPYASVSGLTALAELSALRDIAFSNVVILLRAVDEVGNRVYAEWLIEADHSGPFVLDEDVVVEATGRHVQLAGVSVADFREGKIRSYRTYFDDLSMLEQIVGA
jgi:ketosteroid isomerase-like protein